MNRPDWKAYPPEARLEMIKSNSDDVEEMVYSKAYDDHELDVLKDELAENSIKIDTIDEEKKEATAEFKHRMDPLKDERKDLLTKIRTKARFVSEKCYAFRDHELRRVDYYNAEGDLVHSRPMKPGEMQGNLFVAHGGRTGTDD